VFVLTFVSVTTPAVAYQNPLWDVVNELEYAADPFVLRWQGKYYLYLTDNYHVYSSDNLVDWTDAGRWISSNPLGTFFWAPTVLYDNGIFYLYYSGPGGGHDLLTSDSPLGPFTLVQRDVRGASTAIFSVTTTARYIFSERHQVLFVMNR
jgi:beta-xylosidase